MGLSIAQLYAAIEPVERKWFGIGQKAHKAQFSKIAKVASVDSPIREFAEAAGPGQFQLKVENQAMQVRTVQLGAPRRVQAATYAAAITISREAVSDLKQNMRKITTAAGALGRSSEQTPEYLFQLMMDRSHTTGYNVTVDNLPLCSTAHITPYGVTYSNTLAVPAALSETSLEDIKTALRQTIGPDGMLAPVMPEMLIVPPALANLAQKLSTSEKTLGSANNDPSVVQGMKWMSFDYLTNQTRFFVKTDADNGFYWDWREEATFERDQIALTMQAIFIAFFRAMWGAEDPRCVYASNAS